MISSYEQICDSIQNGAAEIDPFLSSPSVIRQEQKCDGVQPQEEDFH
jgi:hypothetical protein